MRRGQGRSAGIARGLAFAAVLLFGLAAFASPVHAADVRLIARDDFAPWSARDWPEEGLVTALLRAVLAQRSSEEIRLEWRAQRTERLVAAQNDAPGLAFPVTGAGCDGDAPGSLCAEFLFSDPLIDVATLLFVPAGSSLQFETDENLAGLRLCRPAGYGTDDLQDITQRVNLEVLEASDTPACFERLLAGTVDAVAVNEFHAVVKLFELGLTEAVVPLPRPLSIYSLHVAAPKAHWRATADIARVNDGLARLHQSGAYAAIVDRHLQGFWAELRARRP